MKQTVKLFARAKDLAGTDALEVELAPAARVVDLRSGLAKVCPSLNILLPSLLIAVNNEYASDDSRLPENAEVACFPPVSGG